MFRLLLTFSLALVLVSVGVRPAHAQSKAEGTARTLQKKAMEEDYLASEFGKARDLLEKAIAQCEKCNAGLRARLLRDLGVVQVAGGMSRDRGIDRFVEALRLDPGLALDPDIRNKELDAAFAEARRRLGGAPPAAPPAPPAPVAASDFVHTPVPAQQLRTSIPIYAEYTGAQVLVRVVARYRGLGMTDFQDLPLKTMGRGWGGVVPCSDVQQGSVQYYLQGYSANNDVVAASGDRTHPFIVAIKNEPVAEPPHLPGAAPPAQCPEDCPPGLPGCKAVAPPKELKDPGETCDENVDCKNNRCQSGTCAANPSIVKVPVKLWVGLSASFDYTFVPSADDVCKLRGDATPVNGNNYYCTRDGGVDYPSRTDATENAAIVGTVASGQRTDRVNGGGAFGNVRMMLSLDYAVTTNLMLGGRLGIAFNTYPGTEAGVDGKRWNAPLHAEARATWVFGEGPLANPGLAPYLYGAAGVGQAEASVPVEVVEARTGQAQVSRNVDAWHLAGPAFVAIGGGGRYTIAPRFAFVFGARANFAFGNAFAPSVGPEVGGQVGF